jgi:dienelactone hydrolase
MSDALWPSGDLRAEIASEPLDLWTCEAAPLADRPRLRVREFEYSSRGDRVTGRAMLPTDGRAARPLVIVQPRFGGTAADALASIGAGWAESGAAVASIDLPLHGARADQKLLALLQSGRRGDSRGAALGGECARQAVIDLVRALDALAETKWVDSSRIGFAGFGWGARVGSAFCALDPRPAAVALALDADPPAPAEPDPTAHLERIAPRPLLLVAPRAGSRGSGKRGARSARAAARDGAQRLSFAAPARELPRAAAPSIWRFLARALSA